jgi:hypothetical protein
VITLSVNVISFSLSQNDHIKRLPLFYDFDLEPFEESRLDCSSDVLFECSLFIGTFFALCCNHQIVKPFEEEEKKDLEASLKFRVEQQHIIQILICFHSQYVNMFFFRTML